MFSSFLHPVAGFSLSPLWQSRLCSLLLLSALMLLMTAPAFAGTDTTFTSWVDEVEAWITGSLGKGVSICFVLVGIIGAITRGSLMPIAIGVGCALGLNYAPSVIGSLFTAVI